MGKLAGMVRQLSRVLGHRRTTRAGWGARPTKSFTGACAAVESLRVPWGMAGRKQMERLSYCCNNNSVLGSVLLQNEKSPGTAQGP